MQLISNPNLSNPISKNIPSSKPIVEDTFCQVHFCCDTVVYKHKLQKNDLTAYYKVSSKVKTINSR